MAKKRSKEISEAFKKHFDRVSIPIMDIPKIYNACEARVIGGQTPDEAMNFIRETYQEPPRHD